jgi:hypothetical protein
LLATVFRTCVGTATTTDYFARLKASASPQDFRSGIDFVRLVYKLLGLMHFAFHSSCLNFCQYLSKSLFSEYPIADSTTDLFQKANA